MKKKLGWFDKMMIAVTYAECGALDSVRDITSEGGSHDEAPAGKQIEAERDAVSPRRISAARRLANLIKSLEDVMTSTAFAEAGEPVAAYRIYHQGRNARKKVVLGTDSRELDINTIGYALKLCQRVEAGLEILHVIPNDATPSSRPSTGTYASPRQLQTLLGEIGIDYRPVESRVSFQNELIDHVSGRNNILCVVVGSQPRLQEKDGLKKKMTALAKVFGKMNCPLVVYEQPVPAL